ncbi:hypothetical protein DFH11DRAFT_1602940 [Phellopilus nigrolimitatus]|nr:hypothetical protein DFH11DRAFT_1602940 [Phellopilus nigrolimitatus]
MTRRPQKRRRLSTTSSTTSDTDSTCAPPYLSPPADDALGQTTHDLSDPSCTSCHRYLAVSSGETGKQSQRIICPRCQATSCSICSRTCTAIPLSMPSTPLLSFSPSPPGTPLGASDNRPLPHDLDDTPKTRTHAQATARHTESSRRRKKRDEDDDDEGTVVGGDDDSSTKGSDRVQPGCGRTFCKNCCIENPQTGTTTCYDCYGLPPPMVTPTHSCHSESKYSSTNPSMASLLL